MVKKAFTTFGAGRSGSEAYDRPMQPLPLGITHALEVIVPADVNPSKFGTWIQRAALEGAVSDDVPEELKVSVRTAAGLLDDPNAALALDMAGTPAGDKMRDKLGCGEDENPYLLFGLTEPV
jgi:hypothetical protein